MKKGAAASPANGSRKKRQSPVPGFEKFLIGWLWACVFVHGVIEGTWALLIGPEAVKAVNPAKLFWTTNRKHAFSPIIELCLE
jgi:hypothetical protein